VPAVLIAPLAEMLDLDAAGALLVAEIEQYVRAHAPAAKPGLDIAALLALAPRPAQYGSVLQPWDATITRTPPTRMQRLRGLQPVTQVTPAHHLDLTARYITHHGWHQGQLWDHAGAVCVLGAQLRVLAAGYGTATTAWRARIRLGNALGYLGHPMPVDSYNDLPTTSRHDVHQLLRKAAQQPD
jgi:hypothetical protein